MIRLLLFFLISLSAYSTEALEEMTFVDEKPTLKDAPTNLLLKSRHQSFYIKALYAYQALNSSDLGTKLLSEFSPGVGFEYKKEYRKLSWGSKASFLRSLYQQPQINTLKKNTADISSLSLYGSYSLSKRISLSLSLGNESITVLEQLPKKVININTVRANSVGSAIRFSLIQRQRRDDYHLNLVASFKYSMSSEITPFNQYRIGAEIIKRGKLQEIKTSLSYLQSKYIYKDNNHDFKQILLNVGFSFGEK